MTTPPTRRRTRWPAPRVPPANRIPTGPCPRAGTSQTDQTNGSTRTCQIPLVNSGRRGRSANDSSTVGGVRQEVDFISAGDFEEDAEPGGERPLRLPRPTGTAV